mmetsp:Transcript_3100/g.7589  ORF Transcript_3100/g.7589 Transcript_3100/m.7589 type:complete len:224 (-) Transcript_3100:1642-2313(-)
MQPVDDEKLLLLGQGNVLLGPLEGRRKPIVERIRRVEDLRQDKVEKRPELLKVILDGRSRQEQPVPALVQAPQDLGELRVLVLEPVSLVDDDVLPVEGLQGLLVPHDHVVVGEQDVEGLGSHALLPQGLALPGCPVVKNQICVGEPLGHLVGPVRKNGFRANDQVRAEVALLLHQVCEQGHGLDRLPEAHFVGEDAVEAIHVKGNHPLQALQLVLPQLPIYQQ